jgi:hypothetical protein
MPLAGYDAEGNLTIGSIDMNRPAWAVIGDERGEGGLLQLWADFDVRGEDRILPSAAGVIAYPRRITATRKDLRLLVVGDVDHTGAPTVDSLIGLQNNIEYIRSNVLEPVVSTTGTRAATLLLPSGSTRTANIHVLGVVTQSYGFAAGCGGAIWIGTLQISIPAGRFA